jgi:mannose-6-phosphate isomerase-like protein (cupin superfamily)
MRYVRPLSEASFAALGPPGFEASVVNQLESVMTLAARVAPGGCGPGLHYHACDQFYVILEGESSIQLGATEHLVPAVSLAFVPAGVAHRSWNDGDAPEAHLEFFVPSIGAGRPLLVPVNEVSEAPGSEVAPYVTRIDDAAFAANTRERGFAVQALADASRGVTSCLINAVQVDDGGAGPEVHIHPFDQLFFVLEGELHVDVALQRQVVARHSLVVLPAGVPHTQWNEGPGREVHLAVLTPAPEQGKPITTPVSFGPAAQA